MQQNPAQHEPKGSMAVRCTDQGVLEDGESDRCPFLWREFVLLQLLAVVL